MSTLFLGIALSALGVYLLIRIIKKHKLIDTESVAVVNDVVALGRDAMKTQYAIEYDVMATEPFKLKVYPVSKKKRPGKQSTIYYEKENPDKNYYFKTIGQFDKRFLMPSLVMFFGVVVIVQSIINFFIV